MPCTEFLFRKSVQSVIYSEIDPFIQNIFVQCDNNSVQTSLIAEELIEKFSNEENYTTFKQILEILFESQISISPEDYKTIQFCKKLTNLCVDYRFKPCDYHKQNLATKSMDIGPVDLQSVTTSNENTSIISANGFHTTENYKDNKGEMSKQNHITLLTEKIQWLESTNNRLRSEIESLKIESCHSECESINQKLLDEIKQKDEELYRKEMLKDQSEKSKHEKGNIDQHGSTLQQCQQKNDGNDSFVIHTANNFLLQHSIEDIDSGSYGSRSLDEYMDVIHNLESTMKRLQMENEQLKSNNHDLCQKKLKEIEVQTEDLNQSKDSVKDFEEFESLLIELESLKHDSAVKDEKIRTYEQQLKANEVENKCILNTSCHDLIVLNTPQKKVDMSEKSLREEILDSEKHKVRLSFGDECDKSEQEIFELIKTNKQNSFAFPIELDQLESKPFEQKPLNGGHYTLSDIEHSTDEDLSSRSSSNLSMSLTKEVQNLDPSVTETCFDKINIDQISEENILNVSELNNFDQWHPLPSIPEEESGEGLVFELNPFTREMMPAIPDNLKKSIVEHSIPEDPYEFKDEIEESCRPLRTVFKRQNCYKIESSKILQLKEPISSEGKGRVNEIINAKTIHMLESEGGLLKPDLVTEEGQVYHHKLRKEMKNESSTESLLDSEEEGWEKEAKRVQGSEKIIYENVIINPKDSHERGIDSQLQERVKHTREIYNERVDELEERIESGYSSDGGSHQTVNDSRKVKTVQGKNNERVDKIQENNVLYLDALCAQKVEQNGEIFGNDQKPVNSSSLNEKNLKVLKKPETVCVGRYVDVNTNSNNSQESTFVCDDSEENIKSSERISSPCGNLDCVCESLSVKECIERFENLMSNPTNHIDQDTETKNYMLAKHRSYSYSALNELDLAKTLNVSNVTVRTKKQNLVENHNTFNILNNSPQKMNIKRISGYKGIKLNYDNVFADYREPKNDLNSSLTESKCLNVESVLVSDNKETQIPDLDNFIEEFRCLKLHEVDCKNTQGCFSKPKLNNTKVEGPFNFIGNSSNKEVKNKSHTQAMKNNRKSKNKASFNKKVIKKAQKNTGHYVFNPSSDVSCSNISIREEDHELKSPDAMGHAVRTTLENNNNEHGVCDMNLLTNPQSSQVNAIVSRRKSNMVFTIVKDLAKLFIYLVCLGVFLLFSLHLYHKMSRSVQPYCGSCSNLFSFLSQLFTVELKYLDGPPPI